MPVPVCPCRTPPLHHGAAVPAWGPKQEPQSALGQLSMGLAPGAPDIPWLGVCPPSTSVSLSHSGLPCTPQHWGLSAPQAPGKTHFAADWQHLCSEPLPSLHWHWGKGPPPDLHLGCEMLFNEVSGSSGWRSQLTRRSCCAQAGKAPSRGTGGATVAARSGHMLLPVQLMRVCSLHPRSAAAGASPSARHH